MKVNPTYIHQLKDWPHFHWTGDLLAATLSMLKVKQAQLLARMNQIGFLFQDEASLDTLTLDVVKSSEIEGEILPPDQVRSSIARRLGLETAGVGTPDRNVEGVVEMMLDATQNYQHPLTADRLYGWHAALFPTGRSGMQKIVAGAWRDNKPNDPMQVISGMMGREKVHFQAPDAGIIDDEMFSFLKWFNDPGTEDPFIIAGIAHLWFVSIHPFDDGNGRIARAITDLQLARADGSSRRFYSLSAQIRRKKNQYYDMLESTQKGDLNITAWLQWFLACLDSAFNSTDETLQVVFKKADFWKKHANKELNQRQKNMLEKILDGYAGIIHSSNWGKITNCSTDTALRDINDLVSKGILIKGSAAGRSTCYLLKEE